MPIKIQPIAVDADVLPYAIKEIANMPCDDPNSGMPIISPVHLSRMIPYKDNPPPNNKNPDHKYAIVICSAFKITCDGYMVANTPAAK